MELKNFEELIKNKKLQISKDVLVRCDDEVKLSIYYDDGVIIRFDSEVKVEITSFGPHRLINLLNPTIEYIKITPESYKISLDNMPDIEVKRDHSNS